MKKILMLKDYEIENTIEKELTSNNLNYSCEMSINEETGKDIALLKELGQATRVIELNEIYEIISKHFNVKTCSHEVSEVGIYGDFFLFNI